MKIQEAFDAWKDKPYTLEEREFAEKNEIYHDPSRFVLAMGYYGGFTDCQKMLSQKVIKKLKDLKAMAIDGDGEGWYIAEIDELLTEAEKCQ